MADFDNEFHQVEDTSVPEVQVDIATPGCSSSSPSSSESHMRGSMRFRSSDEIPIPPKRMCHVSWESSAPPFNDHHNWVAADAHFNGNQQMRWVLNPTDSIQSHQNIGQARDYPNGLPSVQAFHPFHHSAGSFANCFLPSGNENFLTESSSFANSQNRIAQLEKLVQEKDRMQQKLQAQLKCKEALMKEELNKKAMHQCSQDASENELRVNSEVANQVRDLLHSEFTCSICMELFVKATTLECSHTFCHDCLTKWRQRNRYCPICRFRMQDRNPSLVIDQAIDKMVEKLSPGEQEERKQLLDQRISRRRNNSQSRNYNDSGRNERNFNRGYNVSGHNYYAYTWDSRQCYNCGGRGHYASQCRRV